MESKQKLAALCRGQLRSDEVVRKVRAAMLAIKEEISTNNGTYPLNGGVISKNEISRRAGIGMTTLFTKKQSYLRIEVDTWLADLIKTNSPPSSNRLSHSQRADAWKRKYESLSLSHHLSELDLQSARSELEDAILRMTKLEKENSVLREELLCFGRSNILPLKPI